jgi:hypothetical protein
MFEMDRPQGRTASQVNPIAERVLLPRYLCFLRDLGEPAMIMNVEEWYAGASLNKLLLISISRITQYKTERSLSYVFMAYTAEQFQSKEDIIALHRIADAAARNAGALAYWVRNTSFVPLNRLLIVVIQVGCACMPDDQLQEDVSIAFARRSIMHC